MSRPATALDLQVPVPAPDGHDGACHLAATVFLPPSVERAPVLVLFPGGGYNRRYFDLHGLSQARHHAEQGTVVITMDYLGAGDSSVPPFEVSDLSAVAASSHAGIEDLLGRLRCGTLADGHEPIEIAAVIGAGQSLGGHAIVGTQAHHRTFDAIAVLGCSVAGTTFPTRPPSGPAAEGSERAMDQPVGVDFAWVFHWDEPDLPADLAALISADVEAGLPARHTPPPWGTRFYPGFSLMGMQDGAFTDLAAAVDVPVLLATGERDVCRPAEQEKAMFLSAPRVEVFTGARMAHMHNFAVTREDLWRCLDELVAQT